MPGPGPKWKTKADDANYVRDCEIVLHLCRDMVFVEGDPSDQSRAAANTRVCHAAGLGCDWPILRNRAAALGIYLPGYTAGRPTVPEALDWRSPRLIRAWAAMHAPDLIDANAEQPPGWLWW